MRCVRIIFVGTTFLAFGLGGLLPLSGCGSSDQGPPGVKIGGAQTDPAVEARERGAAAEESAKAAPKK
jgi:hypothetical protein